MTNMRQTEQKTTLVEDSGSAWSRQRPDLPNSASPVILPIVAATNDKGASPLALGHEEQLLYRIGGTATLRSD